VRAGEWTRAREFSFWLSAPVELRGSTMGIVGFGRIGRRTADLAHAFGMDVLAASRTAVDPPGWQPFQTVSVEELFARSDVVSLHCPLTPTTERLVDARMLARMKPTAFLVNTARGRLVDEEALVTALSEGRLAGAALDTVSREPLPADHPLLAAPNCIVTPHLAWASLAARRRLMLGTAENIRAFIAGRPVNVVS
jgi:glycerate dehydrogenase